MFREVCLHFTRARKWVTKNHQPAHTLRRNCRAVSYTRTMTAIITEIMREFFGHKSFVNLESKHNRIIMPKPTQSMIVWVRTSFHEFIKEAVKLDLVFPFEKI